MLEIGYIGTRGLHLTQEALPDQALDATKTPIRGQTDNTYANIPLRVPLQGFSISSWRQVNSEGASWYNALEASLTKRFSHGLQFLASYTWAKELSSDYGASIGANGGVSLGNQYDPRARYGADPEVRPQRLIVSYVYAPTFFQHSSALVRNTLGGWKIAGVTTIQDGHPLPVEMCIRDRSMRVAVFCAGHEEKVEQGHGRRVRSVKRKRVYGGQIKLIGKTCDRRDVSIRYTDAVRTLFAGPIESLDRHPQTTAKTDSNDNVILTQGSDCLLYTSRCV